MSFSDDFSNVNLLLDQVNEFTQILQGEKTNSLTRTFSMYVHH